MKNSIWMAAALVLAGCGGGGSDATGSDPGSANQQPTSVAGGTPSAPPSLSFTANNLVDTNTFNNYFKYAGVAGDRIVLRVSLNTPLNDTDKARCAAGGGVPNVYETNVVVYNASNVQIGGTCSEDLTYTLPEAGSYVFNFDFPSKGPGIVNAASVKGDAPVAFGATGTGSPVEPKKVNTAGDNSIGSNPFFNYYWISAVKGQQIVVNTTLNQAMSAQQKSRCVSNPGYNTQVLVYDQKLSLAGFVCGESLRFDVPETGNYVIQFNYGSQSAGKFNAAAV